MTCLIRLIMIPVLLVALVVGLVHQRLEEVGLVLEVVVKRRLGYGGSIDNVLHGRGGISATGEALERRPQDMLPRD